MRPAAAGPGVTVAAADGVIGILAGGLFFVAYRDEAGIRVEHLSLEGDELPGEVLARGQGGGRRVARL